MGKDFQATKLCLDFANDLTFEAIDPEVIAQEKMFVFDLICCALAGCGSQEPRKIAAIFSKDFNQDGIKPLGGNNSLSLPLATLINGAFGHVLEMDDSDRTGLSHPGVMVITSALLAAAAYHRNGKDLLTAVIAGTEIMLRVGTALGLEHYAIWHTTSTTGQLGSAIAVGKLIGLDRKQLGDALGNAGTLPVGLWEFNRTFAMSKLLHVAMGNFHGTLSALLAKEGFTGADKILEGDCGLFKGFACDYDQTLFEDFGKFWRSGAVSFKPYPCCRHTHGGIDCGFALHKKIGSRPLEEVSEIIIETYKAAYDVVRGTNPHTTKEGKFSLPYTVCSAMVKGRIKEDNFRPEEISSPLMQDLLSKVKIRVADDIQSIHPYHEQSRVTVKFKNGDTLQEFVADPLGEPENPFTWDMMMQKADDLLGRKLSTLEIESLAEKIKGCEDLSVSEIYNDIQQKSLKFVSD